jgi:hypothetical protein
MSLHYVSEQRNVPVRKLEFFACRLAGFAVVSLSLPAFLSLHVDFFTPKVF